jgi:protocatechuate 3,4-dioxygenase beta subunit
VAELLLALGRHNVRPSHLHMMITTPGFRKLTTALYPEGDIYLSSDVVFGVKKSLVVVSNMRLTLLHTTLPLKADWFFS